MAAMFGGDLSEAEEAPRRAVEHMPQHIGTWHVLARCRMLRGDLDGAEASFRKAYELDRTFGETHGGLAMIELPRGAGSRAQRRADTALKLDPNSLSGQYAKPLLEAKTDAARGAGIRKILSSQQSLRGSSLLEMVSRHAARSRKS